MICLPKIIISRFLILILACSIVREGLWRFTLRTMPGFSLQSNETAREVPRSPYFNVVFLAAFYALEPKLSAPCLVELPFTQHARSAAGGTEVLLENVAPMVKFDRAMVSMAGAEGVPTIWVRYGSMSKVGPWQKLPYRLTTQTLAISKVATRLDIRFRLSQEAGLPKLAAVSLADSTRLGRSEVAGFGGDASAATGVVAFWNRVLGRSASSSTASGDLVAVGGASTGLIAYATYFVGLSDLELWAAAKVPVICPLANGTVTVVGFDAKGNVLVTAAKGTKTLPRAAFEARWRAVAYPAVLIHPNPLGTPEAEGPPRWLNKEHDG